MKICITFFPFYIILFLMVQFVTVSAQKTQSRQYIYSPDLNATQIILASARLENDKINETVTILLPDEYGQKIEFLAWESPVISAEMAETYPDFKTYFIASVKDKSIAGRIFLSRFGLEGLYERGRNQIKIEPINKENPTEHKVYVLEAFKGHSCQNNDHLKRAPSGRSVTSTSNGATRRTYEIAIVGTGEFYQSAAFGNNNNATAQAAVTNIINLDNVRWNIEMAIHLTIFGTPFIYTDPATDPFTPSASNVADQAANAINTNFPGGAYDVGHALHAMTGGGSGVAVVAGTCTNGVLPGGGLNKARGWSGATTQTGLAIGIMVHELGHMFGSPHTYNGTGNNCTGQISSSLAFEIGSGTSIMSYAGLCQNDNNIQASQDNYFHSKSHESFLTHIAGTGGTCSTNTSTGNTAPTVNANPCSGTYTIPKLTPFSLRGSGSDPDAGQTLTYTWEQINEDGALIPTQGFIGTIAGNSSLAPLFRSYFPTNTGNKRVFPSLNTILNASNVSAFEPLPNIGRTINFRLTGRDNNPGNGGLHCGDIAVTVSSNSGPLEVTAPNTAVTWTTGSSQTITWNVNNTSSLFANIDILLSLDGGYSFPIVLVSGTPNDGSHSITLGNYPGTTMARIKIRHAPNSCFEIFDISNTNFTISGTCGFVNSTVCQDNPSSFTYQSSGLALNLTKFYSIPLSIKTFNLVSTDPSINIPRNGQNNSGVCSNSGFVNKYKAIKLMVQSTGTYTFNITGSADFSGIVLYNAASFNPSSPCAGWLGCNYEDAGGGSVSIYNSFSASLNACTEYLIIGTNLNAATPFNVTVAISGQGDISTEVPQPSAQYNSYTFVAVNTLNNLIEAINSMSDFTSLIAGSYCIYGVNYQTTLNPSLWIGQNFNALLSSGNCMLPSANCKPITITCPSTQVTNSGNSGAGTLRDIFGCLTEGATITFLSGIGSNLTAPLDINKSITLLGNTSPVTTIDLNFTGTYGIKVNPAKTFTLNNIKINLSGTATPVLQNNGNLILNNTEVKGNVNPVLSNIGTGTMQVQGLSTVRKI
ncbi:MAG: hypothetical protein IPO92_03510 [Saprospiraceae bacterium]|nr:hypothetical protein [Saprospiraceae bacterium]